VLFDNHPPAIELTDKLRKRLFNRYLRPNGISDEQRIERKINAEMILDSFAFGVEYWDQAVTTLKTEIHKNKTDIQSMFNQAAKDAARREKRITWMISIVGCTITIVGLFTKFMSNII
jgi:hypothetical protein